MYRRELLRLLTMAGTLLVLPDSDAQPSRLGQQTVDEYASLNRHLWQVFALSKSKRSTLPAVRQQLDVLIESFQQSHGSRTHQRLWVLTADLFQLAGEIFFDGNQYTSAAHCYTLAAEASREANAFDLWACALTRHAFISVYERQFDSAVPMLDLADRLARRGDSSLSTRHWVNVVKAEAFAGLGDLSSCQRSLDVAEQVREMSGTVHNGGWLRFDGSRLAEERGTCYVQLGRLDSAQAALNDALEQRLSVRRQASVLTDLAVIGVRRGDPDQLVAYANAAVDVAKRTGSGVVSRKLKDLQSQLGPLLGDTRVRDLHDQLATLTG